jgi:esterase/lipase superfamily enzyme
LTRGSTGAHIARAALEGIAYQVADVLFAMETDSGVKLAELRVDGGAAGNNLLMQFQADSLGIPVVRTANPEATAFGSAYLAGLAVGFYKSTDDIVAQWASDRTFEPKMTADQRQKLQADWNKALGRAKAWAGGKMAEAPRIYPVWFGTNRRPVDAQNLFKGFSAKRDDTKVYYGLCHVEVPESHNFGSIGSSWWDRIRTLTDDRLKLAEILAFEEIEFWNAVRKFLDGWDKKDRMALVFIHGFNVSFKEAAIRAAQIGVDLKIRGIVAFFSWPSKGSANLLNYAADAASIEASERQISDFLIAFANQTPAERVHVIAHSMGNRGLLRAMQRIVVAAANAAKKPFANIIFAAPDVDADVFRDLAKAHRKLAEHATLYLSSRDRALMSSGLIYDAPRTGFVPPVTIMDGIDTVEVSNADLTRLGHGYYGDAQAVLYDMHELIVLNTRARNRLRLHEATTVDGKSKYWKIGQ